ncbi:MAG: hypothetical protein JWP37_4555, partial [Mucilaginibacter sp.]|nr:hypothetical protein [Mucilaginibacter sp.]
YAKKENRGVAAALEFTDVQMRE